MSDKILVHMDSMYDILRSLPLLRGVSAQRLEQIVASTKFHFLKYLPGETVVEAGDPCSHIKFIIKGSVRATLVNSTGRFKVLQTLEAPDVISPDNLFGRYNRYPSTVVAQSECGIMQIEKGEYVKLLMSDEIILFNYVNILATSAQKGVDGILALTSGSLEERIAFWILTLSRTSGLDIVVSCRQRDLYAMFGVPRSLFIATLESLKERGLIDYTGEEIRVVSRKKLATILTNDSEN